jgi:hypothetical protein
MASGSNRQQRPIANDDAMGGGMIARKDTEKNIGV